MTTNKNINIIFGRFVSTLKMFWIEIEPVMELAMYLLIAYLIKMIFDISSLCAIGIVFIYYLMSLLRAVIEKHYKKQ